MKTRVQIAMLMALTALPAWSQTVSYQDDVHPILAERCYECHSGDERRGGLSMDSRETFLEGGEFGAIVDLDDVDASVLLEMITTEDEEERMPPKGDRLSPEQVQTLRDWITQGLDWTVDATHEVPWQFTLHLADVKPPRGKALNGSKHPVDRLVGEYLENHETGTPDLVDDAVHIRRVYLDVLGLLPDPQIVKAFANDDSRDKYETLADTVLADRRSYAEHWMTFWNDALRNDHQGTGYIDGGRKQITRWLYNALYDNMPYDEFASELVAPRRNAEGFINGIKWRGAQTANQQIPLQAARSVSQVFLGVNLKCASCHDSFVDGWKLSDAYALGNAFSTEPLELTRCDVPTGEMAGTRFLWPELGEIDASADMPERRKQVAALVAHEENGHFARVLVNRVWKQFMGRGLVEPLDSFQNEPWDAQLLDWLAADFVENEFDIHHLIRTIITSQTYRLQSDTRTNFEEYQFAGPVPRRLTVEQLYDAMACVTGVWQPEPKFSPRDVDESASNDTVRAWRVPADPLMRSLGRPNREQVTLVRESDHTRLQALELTNGDTLAAYLKKSAEAMLADGPIHPEAIFENALGREPVKAEQDILNEYGEKVSAPEDAEDILWIAFTHPEFQIVF